MKKVAVSIHAVENFTPLIIEGLKGLDYIHVDVMDGKFVNNTNINLDAFKLLKKTYSIPIIGHLMVINPLDYIDNIINHIDILIFHLEIEGDKLEIIKKIKSRKKKVGIAINPDTEIYDILPYLNKIDFVLLMSVYPGRSGQKFLSKTVDKVNYLAEYKKSYNFIIDVDGGINPENAKNLNQADILTSCSAILKAENPNLVIELLKNSDNIY